MSENHLLPCPFCGQVDRVVEHTASVECNRCNARILAEWGKDDTAHKRWNTRPDYSKRKTPQPVYILKKSEAYGGFRSAYSVSIYGSVIGFVSHEHCEKPYHLANWWITVGPDDGAHSLGVTFGRRKDAIDHLLAVTKNKWNRPAQREATQ